MSQSIQIHVRQQVKELTVREIEGNRVVTFKDIDELHCRPEGTASRNFRENRDRFIPGVDYYDITPDKFQSDEIRRFGISSPRGGIAVTESGYLMLVKSFNDDLAWKVQRQLVNSYFRGQAVHRDSIQSLLAATHNLLASQGLLVERMDEVETKLNSQITLDSGQQRRVQRAINERVCSIEQIKEARGEWFRQLHREIKNRWNVSSYKDVLRHDLQEVLNYIAAWVPIRREG
ncbi:ORF6N domain-containing protein [Paenibacillus sp. CN-4]|uniref:ORF6N domain-containing protein n=1 Tax=Paenibacillus nanchangensis TaxID=3348343 RepID=UPI00397DDCDF